MLRLGAETKNVKHRGRRPGEPHRLGPGRIDERGSRRHTGYLRRARCRPSSLEPAVFRSREPAIGDGIPVHEHHRIGRARITDVFDLEKVVAFSKHTGSHLYVEHVRNLPVPASLRHERPVEIDHHVVVGRFGKIASSLKPQLEPCRVGPRSRSADRKTVAFDGGRKQGVPHPMLIGFKKSGLVDPVLLVLVPAQIRARSPRPRARRPRPAIWRRPPRRARARKPPRRHKGSPRLRD